MKKIFVSNLPIMVLSLMIFFSLKSFAIDYTITFAGNNASNMVDSVIVQNMTQGTTVTVPAGNDLTLKNIPTSIENLSENGQPVRVFPNSARDKSIVLFFAKKSGRTQINVFGIDGKKIVGINKDLPAGENSFQLSLPKGIYAIRITGNGFSYAAKVIGQAYSVSKPVIDFLGNKETEAPVSSKIKKSGQQKITSATTEMLYTEGDHLLFKGASGHSKTIVTDVPTQSKTINFNFVDCTDAGNNHYAAVQIGTQVWMVENLKTTKYRDGSSIPNITDDTQWSGLTADAYCSYDNSVSNVNNYGCLYNWWSVSDKRNIAPEGWHVPSYDEWIILIDYLNGVGNIEDQLKERGFSHWVNNIYNSNTYSSGFTALPGGMRLTSFESIGLVGKWWYVTAYNSTDAWCFGLNDLCASMSNFSKKAGFSVRCVKD